MPGPSVGTAAGRHTTPVGARGAQFFCFFCGDRGEDRGEDSSEDSEDSEDRIDFFFNFLPRVGFAWASRLARASASLGLCKSG